MASSASATVVRAKRRPEDGRPSRLERIPPKVRETICERIAIGVPMFKAGESCGVPRRTFVRWLEHGRAEDAREPYRGFAAQVDRALAELAVNGITEVHEHGQKDWRAKVWILEHSVPEFIEQEQAKRGGGTTVNVAVAIQQERQDASARLMEAAARVLAHEPALLERLAAELAGGEVVEGEAAELPEAAG